MQRLYFGTDGIRGTVGQSPITPDFMLRLANAVGHQLKDSDPRPSVVIGKDTRISGYMLESALEAGFNSAGVDVVLLGPIPTPGVAFLTKALRANLGLVISASHNPFDDNGVKFFSAMGTKLDDDWESSVGRYIEFCKSTFSDQLSLKGKKIVVDAAHGAAYLAAPKILKELGAEVISIGCAPDGLNINHEVGATHPETLVDAVLAHQADFGIALDGDADRLQLVDHTGRLFNGDELLYLLALDRQLQGFEIKGVVGTLMTNHGVEIALNALGIDLVRAGVGDRYVMEKLIEQGWLLGGEGSGHLLMLDKHSTGDGIISSLQVLQTCLRHRQSLSQLLSRVQLLSQTLLNVRLAPDVDWKNHAAFQACCRETEIALKGQGRVLIRPSGTEPVLRIMVEATDEKISRKYAEQLCLALE
jgi:phosphoglucosamine mutase